MHRKIKVNSWKKSQFEVPNKLKLDCFSALLGWDNYPGDIITLKLSSKYLFSYHR